MSTIDDLEKRISQLSLLMSGKDNQIQYLKEQLTKAEVLIGKAHKDLQQHDEILDHIKLALDQVHPAFKNQCDKLRWLDEFLNGEFDARSDYYN